MDRRGGRDRRHAAPLPADSQHRLAERRAVRRHDRHRADRDRRGPDSTSIPRCSHFRRMRSSWTAQFATGLGGGHADRHLRLPRLLQRLPSGRRSPRARTTIPRAVIVSVVIVATIYLTMNISIIGVVPWQEAMESKNIAADFMERLYGRAVGRGLHRPDPLDGRWPACSRSRWATRGFPTPPRCRRLLPPLRLPASHRPVPAGVAVGWACSPPCSAFSTWQRDSSGGERADRRAVHRPDRGPARGAHDAARRRAAVSHVALPAAQPDRSGRLAVRAGHGRLASLALEPGCGRLRRDWPSASGRRSRAM